MYYTGLEAFIESFYKRLEIVTPSQLCISAVADALKIEILYSETVSLRLDNYIVLRRSTDRQEWQEFGHEVCHYLLHEGDQRFMHPLFLDLQENQANYFAYHFCIPTFMLQQLYIKSVYDITRHFPVDFSFALHRLEMYQNKHFIMQETCMDYLAS